MKNCIKNIKNKVIKYNEIIYYEGDKLKNKKDQLNEMKQKLNFQEKMI